MGKFTYSKDEMQVNKVLKINQDISCAMQEDQDLQKVRKTADDSIKASIELLHSLGVNPQKFAENSVSMQNSPQVESWDKVAAQAEAHESAEVLLEDLLSEDEIRQAFEEQAEINNKFSHKTGLVNKTDLAFLTIAIALQATKTLVFPYVAKCFDYGQGFDPKERLAHNDKTIESAHRNANDNFKNQYMPRHGTGRWIEILYQTVPYDITKGSAALGINMGGRYHRMYTLGHDPILGWIFGTANILTDCITFNNFHTNRIARIDPVTGEKKMFITPEVVPVGKMFVEGYGEINADFMNLPAAVFAQAQHLKSDEFTKLGLPVPVLSTLNESFAGKLYSENYDALCFARDSKITGASLAVSKLLDMLISLTHGLFIKEGEDRSLYEVRTRKILLISDTIASGSTILNTLITKNPKNLDIGSLLNTVTRLFCDGIFIAKIKQEFVESEISDRLAAEIAELDSLLANV